MNICGNSVKISDWYIGFFYSPKNLPSHPVYLVNIERKNGFIIRVLSKIKEKGTHKGSLILDMKTTYAEQKELLKMFNKKLLLIIHLSVCVLDKRTCYSV